MELFIAGFITFIVYITLLHLLSLRRRILRVLAETKMRLTAGDIRARLGGPALISPALASLVMTGHVERSAPGHGVILPSPAALSVNMRARQETGDYTPEIAEEADQLMLTLYTYEFPTYHLA